MSTTSETATPVTTCAECGCRLDADATIPALDGTSRRCADHDACHDRKEARSGFAA